jgi:hypothetical protein
MESTEIEVLTLVLTVVATFPLAYVVARIGLGMLMFVILPRD